MTVAEVEAILGKGTDITDLPKMAEWVKANRKSETTSVQLFRWGGERYWVRVGFVDGKAVVVERSSPPPGQGGS
jgi:hypothetical protein